MGAARLADQADKMDPHLIDAVWEVYQEVEATGPIWVVGGFRSPATNALLRRRSSGVAKFSQHMLGKAMDFYIPGVPLEASAMPACGCSAAASASIRPPARPSSTSTPATSGTGRACRRRSSQRSSPKVR